MNLNAKHRKANHSLTRNAARHVFAGLNAFGLASASGLLDCGFGRSRPLFHPSALEAPVAKTQSERLERTFKEATAKAKELNATAANENRDFTADEQKAYDGWLAIVKDSPAKIKASREAEALLAAPELEPRVTAGGGKADPLTIHKNAEDLDIQISGPGSYYQPKHFKGKVNGIDAHRRAYRAGLYIAAHAEQLGLSATPIKWAKERFSEQDSQSVFYPNAMQLEDSEISGGLFVTPEYQWDLIKLLEVYGTFRKNIGGVRTMKSPKLALPRYNGGESAYFIGENMLTPTISLNFNQVWLNAMTMGAINIQSNPFMEDTLVEFADILTQAFAYAFVRKEDQCGWLGDGTSQYGGIKGVIPSLLNPTPQAGVTAPTPSHCTGVVVGTGTGLGGLVLGDFLACIAKLPQFAAEGAQAQNLKWYMPRSTFFNYAQGLAYAKGGVRASEVIDGVRQDVFLGWPVEFVQAMPSTPLGNSSFANICAIFGNLPLAAKMGDMYKTTIAKSGDASVLDSQSGKTVNAFQNNVSLVRALTRFAITVHDVGQNDALPVVNANTGPALIGLYAN